MDIETVIFLISIVMFLLSYPLSAGEDFNFLFFFLFILGLTFIYIFIVVLRRILERKNPIRKPFLKPLKKLSPMEIYLDRDFEFNAPELCNKILDWYLQIQRFTLDGDLSPIEHIFSKNLFINQTDILNENKRLGRRSCVTDIQNLDVILKGWYPEGNKDFIVAGVRAEVYKYIETVGTGNVVFGSKEHRVFVEYEWTLQRTRGQQTRTVNKIETINCPNCGAPINMGQSGKCPYCGAKLFTDNHDWVIADMEILCEEPIKTKK